MKNKQKEKSCLNCEECIYIGDGDYICSVDYEHIVIADYEPTEKFNYCKGRRFKKNDYER